MSEPAVHSLVVGDDHALQDIVLPIPRRQVICGAQSVHAFMGGTVPETGWTVRAATLRGLDHAQLGEASQDVFGIQWSRGRAALLVAVADGVGSLPHSGVIARAAVRNALGALDIGSDDPETSLIDAVNVAALEADALAHARRLRGASTLLLAELREHPDGIEMHAATIGDCAVWSIGKYGCRALLRKAKAGRSTAVLNPRLKPHTMRQLINSRAVFFASDGFTDALGDGDTPLADELTRQWSWPPSLIEFVNHVDFRDGYSVDDRTVVAVWPGSWGGE